MKSFEAIKQAIQEHSEFMSEKYNVRTMGVFGSYVKGEQNRRSDVDILVEFDEPIGFFKFLELEEYLGSITGRKIDLVSKKALKPKIGKRILEEAVFL